MPPTLEADRAKPDLCNYFSLKSSREIYITPTKVVKLERPNPHELSRQNKIEYDFFSLVKSTQFKDWVPTPIRLSADHSLLELELIPTPITQDDFKIIRRSEFFQFCIGKGLLEEDLYKITSWRKDATGYKLVDAGCLEWEIVANPNKYFAVL
jgi:hypothetical protein